MWIPPAKALPLRYFAVINLNLNILELDEGFCLVIFWLFILSSSVYQIQEGKCLGFLTYAEYITVLIRAWWSLTSTFSKYVLGFLSVFCHISTGLIICSEKKCLSALTYTSSDLCIVYIFFHSCLFFLFAHFLYLLLYLEERSFLLSMIEMVGSNKWILPCMF